MSNPTEKQLADAFFDRLFDRLGEQQAAAPAPQDLYRRQTQIFCGRWLALRRLKLGFPPEQLAEQAGLAQQMLLFVEAGLGDPALGQAGAWRAYCRQLAAVRNDTEWVWMVLLHALGRVHTPSERVMMRVLGDLNATQTGGAPQYGPPPESDAALLPLALISRWMSKALHSVQALLLGPLTLRIYDPAAATLLSITQIGPHELFQSAHAERAPQPDLDLAGQLPAATLAQIATYIAADQHTIIRNAGAAPLPGDCPQTDRPADIPEALRPYLRQLRLHASRHIERLAPANRPFEHAYISPATNATARILRQFNRLAVGPKRLPADDRASSFSQPATIVLECAELVEETVARNPRLLLVGAPGSGKSVALRQLATRLAHSCLDDSVALPPGWYAPAVPILCSLEAVGASIGARIPRNGLGLLKFLLRCQLPAGEFLAPARRDIRQALLQGQAILLLDGLDDLPCAPRAGEPSLRDAVLAAIGALARSLPAQTRMVVTSRSARLAHPQLGEQPRADLPPSDGWQVRMLQPLTHGQTQRVIRSWGQAGAKPAERAPDQPGCDPRGTGLIEQIERDRELQQLCASPLALALLLELCEQDTAFQAPSSRGQIYEQFVARRLNADCWPLGANGLARSARRRELQRQAFICWASQAPNQIGPEQLSSNQAGELRALFPDSAIQAFLAACHLASMPRPEQRAYQLWQNDPDEHWRDLLILMSWRMRQLGRCEQQLLPWLSSLVGSTTPLDQPKSARQLQRDALLAADCFQECGGRAGLRGVPADAIATFERQLAEELARLLAPAPLAPAEERLRAGRYLGALGDVRPGVLTVQPEWCPVPAAQILIARYPITNAQWRRFIDAAGYAEARWWGSAWDIRQMYSWSQPAFWDDTDFNAPNQPVVGISWYEAAAFCSWLTAQGHAEGWLCPDQHIRPPTTLEWQRAASGAWPQVYPWGNSWGDDLANTQASAIGRPAPVGCFPHAQGPTGALDLSGNIAEWCSATQEQRHQAGPKAGKQLYVRCGGSWAEAPYQARCDSSIPVAPSTRGNLLGLRVAAAPLRSPSG